jgi:hypothetical protein
MNLRRILNKTQINKMNKTTNLMDKNSKIKLERHRKTPIKMLNSKNLMLSSVKLRN